MINSKNEISARTDSRKTDLKDPLPFGSGKKLKLGAVPRIDPPVDRGGKTRTVNDTGIVESNNESRYSPCSSHPRSSSFDA